MAPAHSQPAAARTPALRPLDDFTIDYVRGYMQAEVPEYMFEQLRKLQQEHWRHHQQGITVFANDGGEPSLFGFTVASRKCSREVYTRRWSKLGKELSPRAKIQPASKIYSLYNACSITVQHRGQQPAAKTNKKSLHHDHYKFDAAKFYSPKSQRHRTVTQGTMPSVRIAVQMSAASLHLQMVEAGAVNAESGPLTTPAVAPCPAPASPSHSSRKGAAGRQRKPVSAALEQQVRELAEQKTKDDAKIRELTEQKNKDDARILQLEHDLREERRKFETLQDEMAQLNAHMNADFEAGFVL